MPTQRHPAMVAGNAPHVVAIPFLLKGHSIPMLHLCRHLASSAGCEVTLLDVPSRQPQSGCDERSPVRLEQLPFRSWPEGSDYETIADYLNEYQNLGGAVLDTLLELSSSSAAAAAGQRRLPRISCVVSDVLVGWGKDVATGLGVPWIAFWTSTAAELLTYYHIPRLVSEQVIPPKASKSTVCIPGLPALTVEDYPTFDKVSGPEFPLKFLLDKFVSLVQLIPKADRVLLNSAHDLEGPAIDSLRSIARVYPIGPLHMLDKSSSSSSSSSSNEGDDVIEWLDGQAPRSVLYVAFGTTSPMPAGQVEELALAIEASNVAFLWVVGQSVPPAFAQGTRGRGLLVKWAPQSRVLRHPSVGGFLTHCGWNSVLESVGAGVPMIARPIVADQVLTSKFLVDVWGVALGLGLDAGGSGVASNSQVERAIKELMGDGGRVRIKAEEMGSLISRAMGGDGSSYVNVESLVRDLHRWTSN